MARTGCPSSLEDLTRAAFARASSPLISPHLPNRLAASGFVLPHDITLDMPWSFSSPGDQSITQSDPPERKISGLGDNLETAIELTGLPASEAQAIFAGFDHPAAFAAPKFQQLAGDSQCNAPALPRFERDADAGCKPA